jgi:hypothetical protein
MNKPLLMSALLFVSAGCAGSSGDGKNSSEALAEATLNAMIKGDSDEIGALFPSENVINELFDCENQDTLKKMYENLNEGKEKALKEAKKGLPEGMTVKYTGFETSNTETMPAGTEDDGCKLKTDISMIRGKVSFEVTMGDKIEKETERIETVKIGEKHYLVEM